MNIKMLEKYDTNIGQKIMLTIIKIDKYKNIKSIHGEKIATFVRKSQALEKNDKFKVEKKNTFKKIYINTGKY